MHVRKLLLLATATATAALSALACGGHHHGAAPTPTPTASTVHVRLGTPPAQGVVIAIETSAGTVASTLTVGATGAADIVVPPLGSFTAYAGGPGRFAYHVLAPPDGATVLFSQLVDQTAPPPSQVTKADITISPVDPRATEVGWAAPCGGGVASAPLVQAGVTLECKGNATFDIIAIASNATNQAVAWGALLGQASSPGNTLTVAFAATNTSFDSYRLLVSNVPDGDLVSGSVQGVYSTANLFSGITTPLSVTGPGNGTAGLLSFPAGLAKQVRDQATMTRPGAGHISLNRLRPASSGFTETVDFGALDAELPAVVGPAFAPVDTNGHLAIFYSTTPSAFEPQLVEGVMTWTSSSSIVQHQFWAPAGTEVLRFPDVPAGFESWAAGPAPLDVFVLLGSRDDATSYGDVLSFGSIFPTTAATTPITTKTTSAFTH